MTVYDRSVKRNFFTRYYEYAFADRNFFGINLRLNAVSEYPRRVGANVHKRRNRLSRLADRIVLKEFAYLIEQYNGYRFGKIAGMFDNSQNKRAQRGDRHKEVFIEYFTSRNVSARFIKYVVRGSDIYNSVHSEGKIEVVIYEFADENCDEENRNQNGYSYCLYFVFIHDNRLIALHFDIKVR